MRKEDHKRQYFLGYEVKLDGSDRATRFLREQIVSRQTAKNLRELYHLELTFNEDGKLIDAVVYDQSLIDEVLVHGGHGDIFDGIDREYHRAEVESGVTHYADYPLNECFGLLPNALGMNFLGGEPDSRLTLPTLSVGHPIPYLGLLNHHDPAFSKLLEFDLHLLCPLFHNFEHFWVDYSNPMAPVILDEGGITVGSSHIPINAKTFILFEKLYFSTKAWPNEPRGGHTGAALWQQGPDIPACPKTGAPMKLLCQLGESSIPSNKIKDIETILPKVASHNVEGLEEDSYMYQRTLTKMQFYGDWELYVFYCPTSRIARYSMQGS